MPDFWSYLLVTFLAAAVPGPDFAIVTRNALASRGFGVATAGGIACGLAMHALLATIGLSALVLASATAFTVVKIAGALYLAVLGLSAILAAVRHRSSGAEIPGTKIGFTRPRSRTAAFRQGLMTNVLNPKVVIFFLSLLPQFIPGGASTTTWTPVLAAITVVVAFVWFSAISVMMGALSRFLSRPRVARSMDGLTGVTFLGLGARLALERR